MFFFWHPGKTGPSARVNAVAKRKSATLDIPDRREYAGVVQWQNTSLPSWERGSDSRHRLQGVGPKNLHFFVLAARNRRAVTGNMAHLRQRAEAFVTAWRDIGPSREGFPAL